MATETKPLLSARCSSLPLLAACPAAGQTADWRTDAPNEAADLGSAVHALLANRIAGHVCDIDDTAQRFGADRDELEQLFWWGWRAWQQVAIHFPDAVVELPLEWTSPLGTVLTGHADVVSAVGDEVRVCDHKSGRADVSAWDQVRGYCWLLFQRHPAAVRVYGSVIRVRDQLIDGRHFERAELAAWWAKLEERLLHGRDDYAPGRHCVHCPRRLDCPARSGLIRSAMEILGDGRDIAAEPATVARTYDAVKVLESACEEARNALRLITAAAGGTFDLQDGRQLEIVAQKQREIEPRLGLPVLREHLTEDEIVGCMKLPKTKVEAAVKETVGRGQKGQVVKEVFGHLEAEGAILTKTIERLECRRSDKTIGAEA